MNTTPSIARNHVLPGAAAVAVGLTAWRLIASRIPTPRLDATLSLPRSVVSVAGGSASAALTIVAARCLGRPTSSPSEGLITPLVCIAEQIDDQRLISLRAHLEEVECEILVLEGSAGYTLNGLKSLVKEGRTFKLPALFVDQNGGAIALAETLGADSGMIVHVEELFEQLPEGHKDCDNSNFIYEVVARRPDRSRLTFCRNVVVTKEHIEYIANHLLSEASRLQIETLWLFGASIDDDAAVLVAQRFPNLKIIDFMECRSEGVGVVNAFSGSNVEKMILSDRYIDQDQDLELPSALGTISVPPKFLDRLGGQWIRDKVGLATECELSIWQLDAPAEGGGLDAEGPETFFSWLTERIDRTDKSTLDLQGKTLTRSDLRYIFDLLDDPVRVKTVLLDQDAEATQADWLEFAQGGDDSDSSPDE